MRGAAVILVSLFSSLCHGGGSNGNQSTANVNARSWQISPTHNGTITGPLMPPLTRLWTLPVTGDAGLAPIVTNGVVYIAYSTTTTGAPPPLFLHYLNETTGTDVLPPIPVPSSFTGLAYNDGILVYATSDQRIAAFDAMSAAPLWSVTLPRPTQAVGLSVVMANGAIYYTEIGQGGHLYSLDEKTGKTNWVADGVQSGGYGFPAATIDIVLASGGDGVLHAFNVSDGKPRWATTGQTVHDFGSSAICGGVVVATGNDSEKAPLFDLTTGMNLGYTFFSDGPSACDGSTLFSAGLVATNLRGGAKIWSYSPDQGTVSVPLVVNGTVYAQASDISTMTCGESNCSAPAGALYAVSEATGAELWADHSLPAGDTDFTLDMASDGNVLIVPTGSVVAAYGPGGG
jgi:outer membrane protein assembly factor BamB